MKPNFLNKELSLIVLFERFINDSLLGRRLQPNGKKLAAGTIKNYGYTLRLLKDFSTQKQFELRIRPIRHLNKRQIKVEKNFWIKFYKRFTDYLYADCGHYDNYVGQTIKNIRSFFNYLNKDLTLGVGEFHKLFYVRKEGIAIFPLMPEELNYIVYDEHFGNTLSRRMKEVKDFFVFGCTVALRVSDLLNLKKSNITALNGQYYLSVRSLKTSIDTLIRLPDYAVEIISKYERQKKLLPHFNKNNLNKYIKQLLEKAGFTHSVQKLRKKRGLAIEINKDCSDASKPFRFCDVACTHTMRRTAITTMLSLGMPEQLVRKISGHAPASKEFYRYVHWAQAYQDIETEKVFEKLRDRKMKAA